MSVTEDSNFVTPQSNHASLVSPSASQTKNATTGERRTEGRYAVEVPCLVRRVLPNGDIDLKHVWEAILWDVSESGVALLMDVLFQPGTALLISVEQDIASERFQCVTVVGCETEGKTIVRGTIDGPLKRVFEKDILVPEFSNERKGYAFPVSAPQLASLCSLRALSSMSLDFIKVCPKCQAIPTIRDGCSRCLSGHIQSSKMIHHFACANVDFVEAFEAEGELVCAKCRGRKMIIGADFEYLDGPNRCLDCHQANLDLIEIGHCMGCNYRFPMKFADKLEVFGYRVSRLDILDFIHPA